jgi:hypothetical protein
MRISGSSMTGALEPRLLVLNLHYGTDKSASIEPVGKNTICFDRLYFERADVRRRANRACEARTALIHQ